jgi:probable F420-dependent oxidoreductase
MSKLDLGALGVSLNVTSDDGYLDDARQLERLGYGTVWLPGGQLDSLERIAQLIRATTAVQVAPGIISAAVYEADEVARLYADLQADAPDRFVVGLGGAQKPPSLAGLNRYLDELDQAVPPVPVERRVLAALGPRKLEIARSRCAGAIALLVTPEYTSHARAILGEDRTLVIDQFAVLDSDSTRARQTAREHVRFLAGVPGYRANFARMGFTETDIAELSDQLVDAVVAWGDADAIAERVMAHRDAGADHVILAALADGDQPGPLEVARQLADHFATSGQLRGEWTAISDHSSSK